MTTPLPETLRVEKRPPSTNNSLWYDKFCNTWNSGWLIDSPAKLRWMETVTGQACGERELLEEHTERLTALADQLGGGFRMFTSTYRFISGLGREHPVENGFAWHHSLGTPYLPGSSVKGMLRSYLATWADTPGADITRIFGPREDKNNHAVGSVIFLDAIPTQPVTLEADVMTPHYGPYYQHGETPGDWHSPVPIPFLTVAKNTKFLIAVLPRTRSEQDIKDCEAVLSWLAEALQATGAGAKTAIGYGRFKPEHETIHPVGQGKQKNPAATEQDPILSAIDRARPGEIAQVAEKIMRLTDPASQKQAVQTLLEKTSGKDFKKIRQKAGENAGHWLNKIKAIVES